MVVGVVGVVTSAVLACRATLKVDEVFDTYAETKEKIVSVLERGEDTYIEKDANKDLMVLKLQTGFEMVKLYAPSVVIGSLSIACLIGSHVILKKRNVALMAAYKLVEKGFADYRKRVIDEFGEEKDRLLKNGITQSKISVVEIDENGKTKKSTKVVETVDPNAVSMYAKFFDEASINWSKTPEYNLTFLKCAQNTANDLLHSRKHIFLNEVYDMIGVPRTKAGAVVGWVLGEGDDYVDFGIFTRDTFRVRDFVNGYERSILLDFNVTGVIYDMI
jgi:hypothetical protein